jgi:hypothetical protein
MSSFQPGMSGTTSVWEDAFRKNISPIVSRLSRFDRWVILMSAAAGKARRYYWLLLAESDLTRRLFGAMVRRIELLPLPAG